MEALRAQPIREGETVVSSMQVVSQVLSKNSSNNFLKSVGINPAASSKLATPNESELREQLVAEAQAAAQAAVQGELEELRKRSEAAEEKLVSTQREMQEMRKLIEQNNMAMEENNTLLKRILSINMSSST